jgi:hypothetical protein
MQRSSLLLSALALLAHSVSGFYIYSPYLSHFSYTFAAVRQDNETGHNSVAFYLDRDLPYANLMIDSDGNLKGDFVFRQVANGEWLLSKTEGSSEVRLDHYAPWRHHTECYADDLLHLLADRPPRAVHSQRAEGARKYRTPCWCVERLSE